jgi:hypothetical protein
MSRTARRWLVCAWFLGLLTACSDSTGPEVVDPLGYFVMTGAPTPESVFDVIDQTYYFPNNLTNSIWLREQDMILTGEFSTSGYWAFSSETSSYSDTPDFGTDIHARMVHVPETGTVIYSRSASANGIGPADYDDVAVASVAGNGLLSPGRTAEFLDGFDGDCQLTSSSATEFLCYDGSLIRRYLTDPVLPTLTANGATTLTLGLPAAAECNPGSACYGGTFAFDGAYFYFSAHQGTSSNLDYIVYRADGTYVDTYTAAGSGSINGVYFDWSVGRYSTHDGFGGRTGGTEFGDDTDSDTHTFGPVSAFHELQ